MANGFKSLIIPSYSSTINSIFGSTFGFIFCLILCLTHVIFWPVHGMAHTNSNAYLKFHVDGSRFEAQWDIGIRDLDHALPLDQDGNGKITWGELKKNTQAIAGYALPRLRVALDDGRPCHFLEPRLLVNKHADGNYLVLQFSGSCPARIHALELNYNLLFDTNAQHRGLVSVEAQGRAWSSIFSQDAQTQILSAEEASVYQAWRFLREGIKHILSGTDHILFLLGLLLACLRPPSSGLRAAEQAPAQRETLPTAREVCGRLLKLISAFTLAHSISLALALFDVVVMPSVWVESLIAASLVVVAFGNLLQIGWTHGLVLTASFGLIHGLGFAGVLQNLNLPAGAKVFALVFFNLGVELGQLCLIVLALPLLLASRKLRKCKELVFWPASLVLLACGLWWVWDRGFGVWVGGK